MAGHHDHDPTHTHPAHGPAPGHAHAPDHDHHGFLARLRHAVTPHSHDHTDAIHSAAESSRHGIRAAWVSLVGMAATAALQIVIVLLSGSMALLADTVHNLGHLATTIPLIIAFRLGQRSPNRRYPYGYKRAEDLVGLLIGLVIAASAGLIIWESVRALADPRELSHLGWVVAAAVIGAVGNEVVAVYRIRVGRRIGSAALIAEGQHARTDALTSVAVILGAAGAWAGVPQLDPLVGLAIAAVILAVLVSSMRTVVRRLMDGVDEGTLDRVETLVRDVPGVVTVDRCRARWIGHRLEADLDLGVAPDLSVLDGHAIAHAVHHALVAGLPHLDRATIHVNPAGVDDAHAPTR